MHGKEYIDAKVAIIKPAAEKVLNEGKMNVMLVKCSEVIAMCDRIERLSELLGEVLPHVECANPMQSQLITEIGQYLEALKGNSK